MGWQELIKLGLATELQVRTLLRKKAPEALPRRKQHFISASGLHDMLLHCARTKSYYKVTETARSEEPLYMELCYDFRYNSLLQACDMLADNGLIAITSKYSRFNNGNKCIDHVDRLGIAYVHNNMPFLKKVEQKSKEYRVNIQR